MEEEKAEAAGADDVSMINQSIVDGDDENDQSRINMSYSSWGDEKRLNFENRLEVDKHRNEMVPEFKRSLEMDENFLQLTNTEAIDYVNLGTYMECVMEEFKKALSYKLHLKALKNNN